MHHPHTHVVRPFTRIGLFLACLVPLALGTLEAGAAADGQGLSIPVDPAAAIPTYEIALKDGALQPPTLVVPAKTRFRLRVTNIGTRPSEFESNRMRLEEVLFMGAQTTMTVRPLDPGDYDYVDEFQPGVTGRLTAKAPAP